ncbi:alkane hydroxylase MAH1-like [Salvia hispanica]|uniref:alkane hydroxylase MAH1-like n=1 Tax=Salvia hispanica TaxID=49212 RepID=UPI0020090510|nr:alkane hydroxylase MAH1-like [Salvia hispanica]
MAFFFECFFLSLSIILLFFWSKTRHRRATSLPTNWPVVGMVPSLVLNIHRLHDYATELAAQSGGTFQWKGPLFCNMDMLLTTNPANIHHIFSRNFSNYPKGPEFNKIFDILGDGIFNADFQIWELHRRTTLSFFTHPDFYPLLQSTISHKIQHDLLPVLDHFSQAGTDLDLQDVFQRFTFDGICKLVLDHDPRSLCLDMPLVACEKAFNDAVDALLYRHLLPEGVWRLQKRLGIGKERKLKEASRAFDDFIYPCVERAEEELDRFSLLASFKKEFQHMTNQNSKKFLRDTALNLMLAGRDTTGATLTWFFWLIARHPSSEAKIREEIDNCGGQVDVQNSRGMVYLHGALCETLRLYPPVALEHKAPMRPDILPCGKHLEENAKVIISFYTVGRMESVWGKDCLEFKPERWISPSGKIKHEASYKFPAFNAGPRTCLGKEMAFIQMKMVAAAILQRYHVKLVEGHVVSPRNSVILQTEHGLKVTLSKITY